MGLLGPKYSTVSLPLGSVAVIWLLFALPSCTSGSLLIRHKFSPNGISRVSGHIYLLYLVTKFRSQGYIMKDNDNGLDQLADLVP